MQKKNSILFKLIYLFICFTYLLIFLSGERSAFIHASIIFIFLSLIIKETRIYFIVSSIFISLILGFVINTNDIIKKRMFLSVLDGFDSSSFSKSLEFENIIFFTPVHDRFIRASIDIFIDNKIIGSGPNTYRYECKKYSKTVVIGLENLNISCTTHPHNTYAQILSETGIIGFTIVLVVFLYLLFVLLKYIILKKNEDRYFVICLSSYFLIALFPFTPTGNFFNNWVAAIYFLPLGIFLTKFNLHGKK
tara:strand:- start:34 stop:780 length:747 start_codon:yes stop_codon:yes gene_type:complete